MITGIILKECVPDYYVCKKTELITENETLTFDEILINETPPPALSLLVSTVVLIGDTDQHDIRKSLLGTAVYEELEIDSGVYKYSLRADHREPLDLYEVTYRAQRICVESLIRCLNASARKADYIPINDSAFTQLTFSRLQDTIYDATSAVVFLHLPMRPSVFQNQQFALAQSFMQWKSAIQHTDTRCTQTQMGNDPDSMARMAIKRYRNIHNLLSTEFAPRIALLRKHTLESQTTAEQVARHQLSEAELAVTETERAIDSSTLIRDALLHLSESCAPTIAHRSLREELSVLTSTPVSSSFPIAGDTAVKVHGQRVVQLIKDSANLDSEVADIRTRLTLVMAELGP